MSFQRIHDLQMRLAAPAHPVPSKRNLSAFGLDSTASSDFQVHQVQEQCLGLGPGQQGQGGGQVGHLLSFSTATSTFTDNTHKGIKELLQASDGCLPWCSMSHFLMCGPTALSATDIAPSGKKLLGVEPEVKATQLLPLYEGHALLLLNHFICFALQAASPTSPDRSNYAKIGTSGFSHCIDPNAKLISSHVLANAHPQSSRPP